MRDYTIIGYAIYSYPVNSKDSGEYLGKTPILKQAETFVNNANKSGCNSYIKALCSDGVDRWL